MCGGLLAVAVYIGDVLEIVPQEYQLLLIVLRVSLWLLYWFFQGLVGAGIFCLGHDAGHGSLTPYDWLNDTIGFVLHTLLLIPYFAWKATHQAHHRSTSSLSHDEVYVPKTREQLGLPSKREARKADYAEIFEETPLFTLLKVWIMQAVGWWMYLLFNTLGSPSYPEGTNHFDPASPLFKSKLRPYLIFSNLCLGATFYALWQVGTIIGFGRLFALYGIPYILTNHWIVIFTYLHHSDPTLPHYNDKEWTWLRGALATVDRPLLGWMGRFFLHNIAHDHIAHHLFYRIPFYNAPQVTKAIKEVLEDDYNYDSTNTAYAFWRSFNECIFIEDDEPIAFYKNKLGRATRKVHPSLS